MTILLPTEREMEQIRRAFGDADVFDLTIRAVQDSPWLMIDAWVHMEGPRQIALWRLTGAVHKVNPDGSVEEDQLITEFPE